VNRGRAWQQLAAAIGAENATAALDGSRLIPPATIMPVGVGQIEKWLDGTEPALPIYEELLGIGEMRAAMFADRHPEWYK
jgi:hypothetical protein